MHPFFAVTGEAVVEADVAPLCPAEVLQRLSEGLEISLPDLVVLGEAHDHADTPQPGGLFRARGERPDCGTTEQCDERPAHHIGHRRFSGLLCRQFTTRSARWCPFEATRLVPSMP